MLPFLVVVVVDDDDDDDVDDDDDDNDNDVEGIKTIINDKTMVKRDIFNDFLLFL